MAGRVKLLETTAVLAITKRSALNILHENKNQ